MLYAAEGQFLGAVPSEGAGRPGRAERGDSSSGTTSPSLKAKRAARVQL